MTQGMGGVRHPPQCPTLGSPSVTTPVGARSNYCTNLYYKTSEAMTVCAKLEHFFVLLFVHFPLKVTITGTTVFVSLFKGMPSCVVSWQSMRLSRIG